MIQIYASRSSLFYLFILILFTQFGCDTRNADLAAADYSANPDLARCSPGSRGGRGGVINGESTLEGITFNVRTPLNYDLNIAHPLLVVYAPAGANRKGLERETQLTRPATAAGFIVAYADHPELSTTTTMDLGTIPGLIAKKWCVDERRVYLTGHSDGGTVAMALAFMAGTKNIPAAIAPSAAGMNHESLYDHRCPDPIPVMVIHSVNDQHFRNYGKQSVAWWADCNECSGIATERLDNGCVAYTGCKNAANTWYCEGTGAHSQWPTEYSTDIIQFFQKASRKLP